MRNEHIILLHAKSFEHILELSLNLEIINR